MKRIICIITLIAAVCSTWAENRIAVSSSIKNGTVTVDNANPTGDATVTLTVTPATGYYINANDIIVKRTALAAQVRQTGSPGIGIDETVFDVSPSSVNDTGEGIYTFNLAEGYGAYIEATFTACTAIAPQVTINNWTYGETAANPYVTNNNGGGTVTFDYKKKGAADDTYSGDTPKDAGDYTIRATVAAKGHYLGNTATADFTIKKKALDATVTVKDKTYDGNTTATVNAAVETGVTGESLTISGVTATFADANAGTNKTVTINSENAVVTAGANTKVENYTVSYPATTTASITAKGVNPNPADGEGMVTVIVSPTTFIYNGEDQKPTTITVKDGETEIPASEYTIGYRFGNDNVTECIDAKTYTVVISDKAGGNYTVSGTATFTIEQKEVGLTWDKSTFVYDKVSHQPLATATGIVGNDNCNVSSYTVAAATDSELTEGKAVNVGNYTVTATELDNANYKLPATTTQAFTITANGSVVFNVSFDPSIGEDYYVYDGQEKKPNVIVKDGDKPLVLNTDYTVGYLNNVDAGENTASVTVTGINNYNGGSAQESFSITPKPLTATVTAKDKTYDRTAKADVSATVETGVTGETLTISGVTATFADANVGTNKTVTINSDDAVVTAGANTKAENYTVSYPATTTASITAKGVNPNPADGEGMVTVIVSPTTFIYNGKDQKPTTITVKDGEAEIPASEYTVGYKLGNEDVTETKDADTYTVVITDNAGGNYTISGTATYVINQKEVGLMWSDLTFTYNGASHQPTATVTGIVENDVCNVSNYTVAATTDSELTEGKAVNVGNYTVTALALDNANYKLPASATQTFSIVEEGAAQFSVSFGSEHYIYDGKPKTPAVTVKDGDMTLTKDTDYKVEYNNNINAGENTASVTVTGINNFSGTKIAYFTIEPKEVGLTWSKSTFVYDKNAHQPTATATGIVENDVCNISSYTVAADTGSELTEGKAVNAGNYSVTALALDNPNYKLPASATQTFTITPKGVNPNPGEGEGQVTVNVSPTTFIYNGKNQKPTSITVLDGEMEIPASEYTVGYKLGNDIVTETKDAGTYTVVIADKAGGNYTVSGTATYSITPKALTATVTAKAKTYDGTTKADVSATVETGVTGETLTISGVTGTFKDANAGNDKEVVIDSNNATIKAGDNTKVENYTVSYPATTTASINAKGVNPNPGEGEGMVTVIVSPTTFIYNGKDQKPTTITVKDGETEIPASEYTIGYKLGNEDVTETKDADTYTVVIADKAGGNYTVSGTATFTINKVKLTITAEDKEREFGTDNPELTVAYSGFVNGETSDVLTTKPTVSTEATATSSVGIYDITVGGAEAKNYSITFVKGKLVITSNDNASFLVTLNPDTFDYDGTAKEPTITVKDGSKTLTKGSDYTVTYKDNVNAGTATVTVTGIGNYNGSSALKSFTINKAKLTITVESKTRAFGEVNPELTVIYSGFVNGEDESVLTTPPTVITTATEDSPAGTYEINVFGAEATNYAFTYVNGTLTVTKSDNTGSGIRVIRNDNQKEVPNVADLTMMTDEKGNKTLRIDKVTIAPLADATATNQIGVTVFIPAVLKDYDGTVLPIYGVGSDIIVTNANVPVTDIYMPDTEEIIDVAKQAFRLIADESTTARIHTSLPLLDDYALTAGLKAEYEAGHVMTTITPTTRYWTFSSGVDVVVPEDVTAYICFADGLDAVAAIAITNTKATVNGKERVIVKANNGVMMGCGDDKGGTFDIFAWPSDDRPSGMKPTTEDAKTYEGNMMVPAIVKTHFEPSEYYILYNNTFHELEADDDTSVSPCKAVLRKSNPAMARILSIHNESVGIYTIYNDSRSEEGTWFSLDGRRLNGKPTAKGIYIHNGKKTFIK